MKELFWCQCHFHCSDSISVVVLIQEQHVLNCRFLPQTLWRHGLGCCCFFFLLHLYLSPNLFFFNLCYGSWSKLFVEWIHNIWYLGIFDIRYEWSFFSWKKCTQAFSDSQNMTLCKMVGKIFLEWNVKFVFKTFHIQ